MIKGTRLVEWNGLSTESKLASFVCAISATLSMIMALNEQDGFQISCYASPSRVFNFSLLLTCSSANLCQALSISLPASLLLSSPLVFLHIDKPNDVFACMLVYKRHAWRPLKPVKLRILQSEALKTC